MKKKNKQSDKKTQTKTRGEKPILNAVQNPKRPKAPVKPIGPTIVPNPASDPTEATQAPFVPRTLSKAEMDLLTIATRLKPLSQPKDCAVDHRVINRSIRDWTAIQEARNARRYTATEADRVAVKNLLSRYSPSDWPDVSEMFTRIVFWRAGREGAGTRNAIADDAREFEAALVEKFWEPREQLLYSLLSQANVAVGKVVRTAPGVTRFFVPGKFAVVILTNPLKEFSEDKSEPNLSETLFVSFYNDGGTSSLVLKRPINSMIARYSSQPPVKAIVAPTQSAVACSAQTEGAKESILNLLSGFGRGSFQFAKRAWRAAKQKLMLIAPTATRTASTAVPLQ